MKISDGTRIDFTKQMTVEFVVAETLLIEREKRYAVFWYLLVIHFYAAINNIFADCVVATRKGVVTVRVFVPMDCSGASKNEVKNVADGKERRE